MNRPASGAEASSGVVRTVRIERSIFVTPSHGDARLADQIARHVALMIEEIPGVVSSVGTGSVAISASGADHRLAVQVEIAHERP